MLVRIICRSFSTWNSCLNAFDCGADPTQFTKTSGKNTMKVKLACADFTFPLLSHENALQLIAMLGFEGVDIGLFEERSHLWPSHEFEDIGRTAEELKQKLDDEGLRPADIFLQMAPDFT